MPQIKTKRIYAPTEPTDGYRVLVDKLYPRGIKQENLHCDFWAKNIAPSTELREWYHEDEAERWNEFRERYLQELETSLPMKDFIEKINGKTVVTLLYASKNTVQNNALVLQTYLKQHII
jgi:uncharacterized protein YeaO (DUF488 family)